MWRTFVSLLWVVLVLFMIFVRFCALSLQLVILPAAGEWCRLAAELMECFNLKIIHGNFTTSVARCFLWLDIFSAGAFVRTLSLGVSHILHSNSAVRRPFQ